jgi:hypothetical protein
MKHYLRRLRTQIRSSIEEVVEFYRTYDAGCCEHQGVELRGYRVILKGKYVIECGLWGRRKDCGRHSVCY